MMDDGYENKSGAAAAVADGTHGRIIMIVEMLDERLGGSIRGAGRRRRGVYDYQPPEEVFHRYYHKFSLSPPVMKTKVEQARRRQYARPDWYYCGDVGGAIWRIQEGH